jgi:nitroreductase
MAKLNALIKNRKSVRSYTDKKVSDSDIKLILGAARLSPSSLNIQPWKFIVVKNKDIINRLMKLCYYDYTNAKNPPVIIAVVVNMAAKPERKLLAEFERRFLPNLHFLNGAMPVLNMVYQATSMGIGSIIKSPMTGETEELLKIPKGYKCDLIVGIGHASPKDKEIRLFRTRKELKELTFYEFFGKK